MRIEYYLSVYRVQSTGGHSDRSGQLAFQQVDAVGGAIAFGVQSEGDHESVNCERVWLYYIYSDGIISGKEAAHDDARVKRTVCPIGYLIV